MSQCPNCKTELSEDNSGPCPVCGHAFATLQLAGVGILDVVKAEVGYGPQKSWLEQWGVVERSYQQLKGIYDSPVDNQVATSTAKDFFIHCWHLKDWLVEDPAIGVVSADIGILLGNDPDLKLCNAMANTSKHHTLARQGNCPLGLSGYAAEGAGDDRDCGPKRHNKTGCSGTRQGLHVDL